MQMKVLCATPALQSAPVSLSMASSQPLSADRLRDNASLFARSDVDEELLFTLRCALPSLFLQSVVSRAPTKFVRCAS
jgi:hypothetical protein